MHPFDSGSSWAPLLGFQRPLRGQDGLLSEGSV